MRQQLITQQKGVQPEKVVSKDGTPISFWRSGQGPPLVLVHGTAADHTRWKPVLPTLEEHFTVYAIDRRGRGGSGDSREYVIEREFEDVASVVDSIREPVDLLGHSYGALCSLEAALLTSNVKTLVLYEPPIHAGVDFYSSGTINKLKAMLDAGDRGAVVTTFMSEIAKMRPADLRLLQSNAAWEARVAAAHTIPRELRADEDYFFDPQRFKNLTTPTLLLVGGDSPRFLKVASAAVYAALPTAKIAAMPGQQHAAMDTGTELFTTEVLRFLMRPEQSA
jgi:pimeloyl-ACP methyl ester carboxylesterase